MKKNYGTQACLNCQYFLKPDMKEEYGVCRCNPPQVIVEVDDVGATTIGRAWPDVHPAEWCGSWSPDQ